MANAGYKQNLNTFLRIQLIMLTHLYPLLRPLLFSMDAEKAHHLTLNTLKHLHRLGLGHSATTNEKKCVVMGLEFPNRLGLAAGLDKNGDYIDALGALGFGFIEIGTITPRPQIGNPLPRLFRLPKAQAIINRMGFNNQGVETLLNNLQDSSFRAQGGILGLNIGKNADTPLEKAEEDYLYCLEKLYAHASYITINISSPNTQNLRQLQNETALDALLMTLRLNQQRLADKHQRYVPLVLKIAPDLDTEQVKVIADTLQKHQIDGVIATNTTLARTGVTHLAHAEEKGGLSGAPLYKASNQIVRQLRAELGNTFPIIGVGGIMNGQDAVEKCAAGADLIQIYTGLIYQGPKIIQSCIQALDRSTQKSPGL